MNAYFRNIRFYVLVFSVFLSLSIFTGVELIVPKGTLQIIRLTQLFAFTAVIYLYVVLLIGPLSKVVLSFPLRAQWLKARRALGVSTFYFALLHASFAFFGQLGGFKGLFFLDNTYLLAISLSFTALLILSAMAATSFDFMVAKLTYKKWKMLHRLVYVAGTFIIIHAVMLGTHYQNLSTLIPQLSYVLLAFLLLIEALAFDKYLRLKYSTVPSFGLSSTIVILLVLIGYFILFSYTPIGGAITFFGIHAAHIKLAQEAQQTQILPISNFPGLQGDKTLRFSVNFDKSENILPNQDTTLRFRVFNASSGNEIILFRSVYSKPMHLIIVDNTLTYFSHIHPEQQNDEFVVTTQFPHSGIYRLYLDFQPFGAIEQQFAFAIRTSDKVNPNDFAAQSVDKNLTKTFGNYEVNLDTHGKLNAKDMSVGKNILTFTIRDAKTKNPVTTLKPYLASFGHLVMISEQTYDYLHVHPTNLIAPKPDENGGPKVEFLPLGIYGPIKPGIYRVFGQFNPDNNLFTADFTIKIE